MDIPPILFFQVSESLWLGPRCFLWQVLLLWPFFAVKPWVKKYFSLSRWWFYCLLVSFAASAGHFWRTPPQKVCKSRCIKLGTFLWPHLLRKLNILQTCQNFTDFFVGVVSDFFRLNHLNDTWCTSFGSIAQVPKLTSNRLEKWPNVRKLKGFFVWCQAASRLEIYNITTIGRYVLTEFFIAFIIIIIIIYLDFDDIWNHTKPSFKNIGL